MKQLISVIVGKIAQQIRPGEVNMVRLENFDYPILYKSVCEQLQSSGRIPIFIAKLALEKYRQFSAAEQPTWEQALRYLHQGSNVAYAQKRSAAYDAASFVDFENAITKWRNESPNIPAGQTSLVLLMGTEMAADDAGSLKDTTYVISPLEIIQELEADYSAWFADVLRNNAFDSSEARKAVHTLYKALFSSININIFKLSSFIDGLQEMRFVSCQELIAYICETLNTTWQVPSVMTSRDVPKVPALSKERMEAAKIIRGAVNFIERTDDIPSKSEINKLRSKFDQYATEHVDDINAAFPADTAVFANFREFRECVIDFRRGINLKENREKLLKTDYGIINKIIGVKLPHTTSEKPSIVTGAPMEAYAKMFLESAARFQEQYHSCPLHYCVRVGDISLSDYSKSQEESAYKKVCHFLGGILSFFSSAGIARDDDVIDFSYENSQDPFDFSNRLLVENRVKCTGKWGAPCKIYLTVQASDDSGHQHSYEYRWTFSPYAPWLNAFSYLGHVLFREGDSYTLPSMVACHNIQDYLRCESEDEFYAQLRHLDSEVLYQSHRREIQIYFAGHNVSAVFDKLCNDFKDFAIQLTDHGFFTALTALRKTVDSYTKLMQHIQSGHQGFTDVQKEKLGLLLNCFLITSNPDVMEDGDMKEVLFPSYNPIMLEKIDAQQMFLRDGFAELFGAQMEGKDSGNRAAAKLGRLVQLSAITQGADFVLRRAAFYLPCKSMWGYFGVYWDANQVGEQLSGNAFGSMIVIDDEDSTAMLHPTPVSNIVVRNIMDYIRTFPARIDGLNVAFIAPEDMQHIVAGIHTIEKRLENDGLSATINLKIFCINSRKNSAIYLQKWLDSYFGEGKNVTVNTFLRNITITDSSDADLLEQLLAGCDLCFNYNVLQTNAIQFDRTGDEIIDKDQAKFPMTFTPDTIPAIHGKSRKVSISQFQFLASKHHTQASYVASNPNSIDDVYRTFWTFELSSMHSRIIEIAHDTCKWVVCVDEVIDREILKTERSRIIGFTTGEGSYGELNVTVSARIDILADIKKMLQKRIKEKFSNWNDARTRKAAAYCVDDLSRYMDGSRILKALNPYDYEIHSFLAYILTLQMLGLTETDERYAVRTLISLDSYKHWFEEDGQLSMDSKRPDFMLIEIPRSAENLDPADTLHIQIKVIECKMGFENDGQIASAQTQLEKGIRTMSVNWAPNNSSLMYRYWLNQLYRAIIFSPLQMNNTSAEYYVIRNKIYGILSGKYEIEWSGGIFAFWLDSSAEESVRMIDSSLPEELAQRELALEPLTCHSCGQLYIQKMLVPPEERSAEFQLNSISVPDIQNTEEENHLEDTAAPLLPIAAAGASIPGAAEVYGPFLLYLNDGREHTRQESLVWFAQNFSITFGDQALQYESNGHYKWETVLDRAITLFRKSALLENTAVASFHLTALGISFADTVASLVLQDSFEKTLEQYLQSAHSAPASVDLNAANPETVSAGAPPAEPEQRVESVTPAEPPVPGLARFLLGEDLRTKEKYYWEFGHSSLNNRHLLINGNSGCGKTYCIQALLLEMVRADVSGVVFDYTSGFTPDKLDPLFTAELEGRIQQRVVYIEKIPVNPFAKRVIKVGGFEVPENDTDVATRMANVFTTVYKFGGQQTSALYKAVKNGLQHHGERMSFAYLEEELNDLSAKQAETVLSKIQPFLDLEPFAPDEDFHWGNIRDSGGMVYVLQLDGFDRPTQLLLTELLLWDIWNYCVKSGNEDHPFVIVLDEAQNLSHSAASPSAKFLTEGRKFGISAWYATQFMKPQLSDDEIQRLQQAGQKLYFCPPDDGVMTVAKNIDIDSQGAKEWAPKLKALKKGECVTCGNMTRNGKWVKYEPRAIRITSLKERLDHG